MKGNNLYSISVIYFAIFITGFSMLTIAVKNPHQDKSLQTDGDGDEDIFLGSYIYSMSELTKLLYKGVETFPQILVLRNRKNSKSIKYQETK